MYRCCKCYEMFEEPETKNIISEEYLGINHLFPNQTRMNVDICPSCGDEDIEELRKCDICDEWFSEDELEDTEGMINGSVGWCCEQCIEDRDIR